MLEFAYEKVTLDDARKVLDGAPQAQTEAAWTLKRCPPGAARLFPFTAKWILELPEAIRPMQLAKLYPRIANDVCRHWEQPEMWERYTADLLIMRRVGRARQGFPARVALELVALNAHHETLYPVTLAKTDPMHWHCAPMRRRPG